MTKFIRIGKKIIGDNHPCFLIAEAGVNHNGSLDLAKKLVDVAVAAKVDAVKFQTFKTKNLILNNIEKAPYQKGTTNSTESQTEMLKKLEINEQFHKSLIEYCREKGIIFLSTPYCEESLELLISLNVPAIKIASTDTTNLLFLEKVAKTGKPVILSTGMCSLSEIELAYHCLCENGCKEIALLKCTSNYPTDLKEVNLKAMKTLETCFNTIIGFSDHTEGIGASPFAVALGAKIIEKHFTLDKNMEGPDHKASLSPKELKEWVDEIRKVEQLLGSKEVFPTESEKQTKKSLQKCFVSKCIIKKGEIISRNNIVAKRTGGNGIPASELYKILDMKLNVDIDTDQPLYWQFLDN